MSAASSSHAPQRAGYYSFLTVREALESLHEDLYFVTLDFFDALGRTTTRSPTWSTPA